MAASPAERALAGWLQEITHSGWRRARVEGAATAAGLAPAELIIALGDRQAAIAALLECVATESAAAATDGESVRERLFDGLMQGFDVLQAERAAVLAIWQARDPGVAMLVAGRIGGHLRRLALLAGMSVSGLRGRARRAALAAILWRAFAVWRQDDSADMAATMAELDRLLEKAETAAVEGVTPDLFGLPGLSTFCRRGRATADASVAEDSAGP